MKVLWFAISPCGAAVKLQPTLNIQGWLSSLEEVIAQRSDIELSVCFYWNERLDPFRFKNTTYYPIYRKGNKSKYFKVINRALHNSYNNQKEIPMLLDVISKVNPDIIHIHGTEENFGLIQKFTNIPVVISIQGILSPYIEKYFSGIPQASAYLHEGLIDKLLFRSTNYAFNEMSIRAKRERDILLSSNNIIGRTNWDKRVTRLLAPNSKYFVGNEILRPTFYNVTWSKQEYNKCIQIVTIISSGLYKGLETIVKTAEMLKRHTKLNFKWIVVGQEESENLPKITKKWLRIQYKELNISLVGSKNEKELCNILLESDIYCHTSHIENSTNSVCEAMLIGMPIITGFVGGTDSIINNEQGILVQDGDPYSYAGAIAELAGNFELATRYATNARRIALNRHDKGVINNLLVDVYRLIIKDHF